MEMEKVMGVINSLNGKHVVSMTLKKEGIEKYFKKSIGKTDIDPTKITKTTKVEVMMGKGVKYRELLESVDAKTSEEVEEELTHKLPWGNWKVGYEGTLIEHKGKTYLRYYMVKGDNSEVEYTYNGEPFDINSVKEHMKKSSSNDTNLLTLVCDITEIEDIGIVRDF